MATNWTDSIHLVIGNANVRYVVTSDREAVGVAEIVGKAQVRASNERLNDVSINLIVKGVSLVDAKAHSEVWPLLFDEVMTEGNEIGVLFPKDEFEQRRGYVYLHPTQFEKVFSLLLSAESKGASLYTRESSRPGNDVIIRIDFGVSVGLAEYSGEA